jgi:hypothetical protein
MMAKQVGISVSSVQRIWHTHGLQPHRVRQFKLSRDRQFATKLRDIVGLGACPRAGHRPDPWGRSAGACGGLVGRREIANPGARPHPARFADEEGPLRDNDP